MKKPLRALFYGQTHEHASGKLETLKKMRDEYEIVAIVDDFQRRSPMYRDQKWDTADYPIVSESEAWNGWGQTPRNARFTGLSAMATL